MTPDEGMRMQIEGYRRMTPQQRLQIGFELYELARHQVRAGVRFQNPQWTEQRIEKEVIRRFRLAAGIPERCDHAVGING
jgi:hypothetical protein